MKKTKLSKRTLALLAAAVILFAGGGYTGTRAVLNTFSDPHLLNINTDTVGITLTGDNYSADKLLADNITLGKEYAKNLRVQNDTNTKQFVRVVVRKYWLKETKGEDGSVTSVSKMTKGLPEGAMDMLKFDANTSDWYLNESEHTDERDIYYCRTAVDPKGSTPVVIKSFTVSPDVLKSLEKKTEGNVTTYTYEYDGYKVGIEVEAQSVQTHNGTEAIKSTWGVQNVSASGDSLNFN